MRFLHTADWQLGMGRHFLGEEARHRFMQARIDAVRAMADLARAEGCAFAVAAGDLFENNQVDRRTLGRAIEAMAAFPCPLFLLPGNHDPHDAGSIWRRREFADRKSITVLADDRIHEVGPGLQVVGAPWASKRPRRDLVAEACAKLEPLPGGVRVLVAHGTVTGFGDDVPERIDLPRARRALDEGRIHYLALGDRHSTTEVAPRVWYSGAPEATDYGETDSGHALVVSLDGGGCAVRKHRTGRWRFLRREFTLNGAADLEQAEAEIAALESKDTTILKADLVGSLTLAERARLDGLLDRARDLLAAVEERDGDLVLRPDEILAGDLGLAGFARATAEELARHPEDAVARDALQLLYRCSGGAGA